MLSRFWGIVMHLSLVGVDDYENGTGIYLTIPRLDLLALRRSIRLVHTQVEPRALVRKIDVVRPEPARDLSAAGFSHAQHRITGSSG